MVTSARKNSEKHWKPAKAILCKCCLILNNSCQNCRSCFINHWFTLFSDEINFLLMCCDTNHDGKIDYVEFTERFHNPAKEIGFNLAVLLTNLSEHMPNEPR